MTRSEGAIGSLADARFKKIALGTVFQTNSTVLALHFYRILHYISQTSGSDGTRIELRSAEFTAAPNDNSLVPAGDATSCRNRFTKIAAVSYWDSVSDVTRIVKQAFNRRKTIVGYFGVVKPAISSGAPFGKQEHVIELTSASAIRSNFRSEISSAAEETKSKSRKAKQSRP